MVRPATNKTTATISQSFSKANVEGREVSVIVIRFAVSEAQAPVPGEMVEFEIEVTPAGRNARPHKLTTVAGGGLLVGRALKNPFEWVVLAGVEEMAGKADLYAEWKDASQTMWWTQNALNLSDPLNTETVIQLDSAAPQMAAALAGPLVGVEKARVQGYASLGADADGVIAIVKHVHERLAAGLGELWAASGHTTCQGDILETPPATRTPLCDCDPSQLSGAELKEAWAQAISEHIVYSVYMGAGNGLGAWYNTALDSLVQLKIISSQHCYDSGFMVSVRERLLAPDGELCLPLCFECQQLTTWVLFTLGHTELADNPIAAQFDAGQRITHGQGHPLTTIPTAKILKDHGGLAIGTYVFAEKYAHVGVLVRVPGDGASFQLLDSGGWRIGAPEGSGNYDTREVSRLSGPSTGFSVPPAPTDDELRTAIGRLRAARPLGVAQLAIFERAGGNETAKNLRWVSPKVPMHEGTGASQVGYPLARLAASLRGIPVGGAWTAKWYVWSPTHPLSDPLSQAKDTNNLDYVIKHGQQPVGGLWWWQEKTPSKTARRPIDRLPMVVYQSEADGTVVRSSGSGGSSPAFLAAFEDSGSGPPQSPSYPSLIDLTSRRSELPTYFGGTS